MRRVITRNTFLYLLFLSILSIFMFFIYGLSNSRNLMTTKIDCHEYVARVSENKIVACGELNDAMLKKLNAIIRPNDTTLQLSSSGGYSNAAIAIAEILNKQKITLLIDGVCASACAHFLFIPVDKVEVLPGAIIGFHHTALYVEMAIKNHGLKTDPKGLAAANEELSFYKRQNLDHEVLIETVMPISPICVSTEDIQGTISGIIVTKYTMYVPDRTTAEQFRRRPFVGYWPTSAREAGQMWEFRTGTRVSVTFGPLSKYSENLPFWKLPICSKEILEQAAPALARANSGD